jgi:Xaa-Pro aminopeptidase
LFDRASHAQQQLILAIKPGVQVDSLYANAKKLLGKYLIHAAGHGIGIEVHEMPVLGPENKQRISQGMVISIEPAIYVPRAYGIRVEDMVHVTRNGCKLLSQPQELITV